ncbi:hypothetical protein IPP75_04595 [Candidatus Saccharibacteria bacterium]|nr:MAG: hypothetical protein IPP75_04595 [Candidatus Saccharibacteria bacterium]
MSERLTTTGPEASDSDSKSSEKDSSDSKSSSKGRGGRGLGGIVARASERGSEKAEAAKAEVAEKSKPILDRILGVKESTEVPTKSSETTQDKPSNTEVAPETLSPEQRAEESVVQALAGEGEINLRELSRVPESRDDAIVERAVEEVLSQQTAEITAAEVTSEADTEPEVQAEAEPNHESEATTPVAGAEVAVVPESEEEEEPTPGGATTTTSSSSSSARPSSSATPSTTGGSGGSGGRPPAPPAPPGPPVMPPGPPYRRPAANRVYNPNQTYGPNGYAAPAAGNLAPNLATPNTLNIGRTIENAEDYAYRRGRNRGLLAGLIVGGGIEHIRHKRREKRMERKFAIEQKEQGKKIENIRWDHIREAETAKVREAHAEKYRLGERTNIAAGPEGNRAIQTPSTAEAVRQRAEIQAEIEKKLAAERKETTRVLSKAEQIEQERLREQLELAQGHHIERSAWHNIEVDSHGKAVQETSFEYGHEYYKERGHETGPKTKQQVDAAAGEVALVAAALGGSGASSSEGGSQGPSNRSQSSSSMQQVQPGAPAKQQSLLKTVTTPPTTPAGTVGWFIALVIILIVLLIVVF